MESSLVVDWSRLGTAIGAVVVGHRAALTRQPAATNQREMDSTAAEFLEEIPLDWLRTLQQLLRPLPPHHAAMSERLHGKVSDLSEMGCTSGND